MQFCAPMAARHRPLVAGLTGVALALTVPAAVGTAPARAAVTGPGVQPGHNITVMADIDFVGVYGYGPAGTSVVVEVVRNEGGQDVTIGRTVAPTVVLANGIGIEINHGPSGSAQVMGNCWDAQTPDIRPGDRIHVTAAGHTDEVTADDIHWSGPPAEDPTTHDVIVDGVARRTDGTPIAATSLDSGEFRNTTGKYRIVPDAIEQTGPNGEFRVHYRAPYLGFRNRENLTEEQRKAALLGENQHAIGFGDVAPLPPESQIINGITDASGPAVGCEGSPAGSTPLPPRDTTPPTLTAVTPTNGSTDVPRTSDVTATFDEAVAIDGNSFWLTDATGRAAASVTFDPATHVATLHPSQPLKGGTTYTAHVNGATDAGRNPVTPTTWAFTTAAASDVDPPTITAQSPADGAEGVALTSRVTVTFSEPVTGIDANSFTLSDFGGFQISAAVTYDAPSKTATLTPALPLDADTPYAAAVSGAVTDAAGNALTPVDWSFTTSAATPPPDTVAPTMTTRKPAPGATGVRRGGNVTITFSEPVTGVSRTTLKLATGAGVAVTAAVRYNATTHTATLDPSATLKARTRYRVTVTSGIRDAAGNRFAGTTWTFTTGAT